MAIKKVFVVSAETKKAQKEIEGLNERIETSDELISDLNKQLREQERLLENTAKTDIKRRKAINDNIKKTKKHLKEEKQDRSELNKERVKANKELKETVKNQKDLTGVLGFVDKATGGALSAMQNFVGSITSATRGMKLLRVAWIASGIGAFVVAVTSLAAAFTQSEEGQEKLQRGLAVLGAITKQIMDSFADLGEAIIDAVSNPMESIKSLGAGLLKFVTNPFKTVKDAVIGAKNSVKEFVDETVKEVKAIDQVTKARQKAHHIERDLLTERAEANREINDIRLEAEKRDQYNATERVALLKKAQAIEEEITQKEINAKKLLIQAQELEMAQGKNTIEDKDKLAKLQAELINLDTKKLRSQRLLQTQITTAQNEEKAEKQRKLDEENAEIELANQKEQKRLDDIQAIRDAHEQKVKEEEAVKEEEKAILEKEKELLALEELNATEEQKATIIAYWDGKIQEGKDKDRKEQKNKDDKEAKEKENREKAVANAKLNIAKNSMSLIGQIAGEGSKIGKAMAIGQATISGYQGVQNAYTTAQKSPITIGFPAYPVIQASLAGAFAALNIAKISKTKASGSSGTSGLKSTAVSSAAAPNVSSIVAQTPSFDILGTSGVNQIASALGQQPPVQAFVVSQDVTTAQSLQNNIVQGASLG
jgi:hypothetical protein